MLGFIKTTDRATGEVLKYYPWSKKNRKKYTVKPTLINSKKNCVLPNFKMDGLSSNDLEVIVNITLKLTNDGQGFDILEGLELYPYEEFKTEIDLSALSEKDIEYIKSHGFKANVVVTDK